MINSPGRWQFFWQDYQDRSYLTALQHLAQLRKAGKIRNLGLCNFDTRRTEEICVELGPGYIVSNQVAVRVTPQSGRGAPADVLCCSSRSSTSARSTG